MSFQDDVKQLYSQQMGRDADASGLAYYTDKLSNGWSVNDVVNAMQASPEKQTQSGGLSNLYNQSPQSNSNPYDVNVSYASTPGQSQTQATSGGYTGMKWDDFAKMANGNTNFQQFTLPDDPGANPFFNINPATTGKGYYITEDPDNASRQLLLTPGANGNVTQFSAEKENTMWRDMAMLAAAMVATGYGASALAGSGSAASAAAPGWVSAEGGAGYIAGAAADASELAALTAGGLDVSQLGLEQFTEGLPNIETLGTTAEGGLAYPGDAGYIPPGTVPSTPYYSNEGRNYPTPESTVNSPVNVNAPTVPLDGPSVKVPSIPTNVNTGNKSGGGGGVDLGQLIGLLYGAYSKNNMSNQLSGYLDQINGMYKPGSPEAELMRKQLDARDAAAGRRSQYGTREVELAGRLADSRMRALSSPGFLAMQAAMMNNSPSMGGLAELLAGLNQGGDNSIINSTLNKILSGINFSDIAF